MFTNDNTECSTKVSVISFNKFDKWIAKQPAFIRNWCLSNNFKGEKGKIIKIPYPDGRLKEVIIGEGRDQNLSGIAEFSSKNNGNYYLFLKYADSKEIDVQKAWAWGGYKYNKLPQKNLLYVKNLETLKFLDNYLIYTNLARDLINTPANQLNPKTFLNIIKKNKLFEKFTFIEHNQAEIKSMFPLTYAVGKASSVNPEILHIANKKITKKDKPIVIIGKGVTFDTGGVNIKPGNSMRNMKKDMGGAAIATSLFLMANSFIKKTKIVLVIPMAENSVSGNSMRPGDIYASASGKKVEISHTDAEGRLLLADAMELANKYNPSLVVDFATLTGAARVALGEDIPAYFSNNEDIAKNIDILNQRKIRAWRLPLYAPYKSKLNSQFADLCNASLDGMAGSITAALFIQDFIDNKDTPWVHFDTYAWSSGSNLNSQGAALQGLDIMIEYLNKYFS
ncbi:leucyl aminopeptidase family protein [Alphaproteobacteria bacterium]|nr:leucyl aminopeptidase family protein [Alphaproteobacteria bacterium]